MISDRARDSRTCRALVQQFEDNLSSLLIEKLLNNPRHSTIKPEESALVAVNRLSYNVDSRSPSNEGSNHLPRSHFKRPIRKKVNSDEHVEYLNSSKSAHTKLTINPIESVPGLALRVQRAVSMRKVFTIHGNFPLLRDLLVARGWVQKLLPQQLREINSMTFANSENAVAYHTAIQTTKKLINKNPNFVWSNINYDKHKFDDTVYYSRLIARPLEYDFARKLGLTSIYNRIYWFELNSTFEFIYPRCYPLTSAAERKYFLEDFRLTYCTSFLYYLTQMADMKEIFSIYGSETSDCITFALNQVRAAIAQKNHYDVLMKSSSKVFLMHSQAFQGIVQNGLKIRIIDNKTPEYYEEEIKNTMAEAIKYFTYIPRDGYRNLWICKPVGVESGCGYGITVMNNETKIMDYVKDDNFIVQKYLEFPLLVYKTKFDIRQYFMITMDSTNINVWMYKNCYLKFSSQEFSLDNLARSIHVTNYTVQKNYTNGQRSSQLPVHNMWVLSEFKEYLVSIGKDDVWDKELYPGMIHIIRTVINASLDEMEHAKNTFQLFGADFMITSDYKPILIEINASPDLSHSTISTKVVCTAVVKDLLKVVLDHPKNILIPTGDFEMVWSLEFPKAQAASTYGLIINGKSIKKNFFSKPAAGRPGVKEKIMHLNAQIENHDHKDFMTRSLSLINEYNDLKSKKSIGPRSPSRKFKYGRGSRINSPLDTNALKGRMKAAEAARLKEIELELKESSLKENYNKKRHHNSKPLLLDSVPYKTRMEGYIQKPRISYNSFLSASPHDLFSNSLEKSDSTVASEGSSEKKLEPRKSLSKKRKDGLDLDSNERKPKSILPDENYSEVLTKLSKFGIRHIRPFSVPLDTLKKSFI